MNYPSYSETPHTQVMRFHEAFSLTIGSTPSFKELDKNPKLQDLRVGLIQEEFKELLVALQDRDMPEVADALGDMVYVIYGFAIVLGINLDDVLEEIQRANMSKLDEDGKPIYREDGKVLKPKGWTAPDIEEVLERQSPLRQERLNGWPVRPTVEPGVRVLYTYPVVYEDQDGKPLTGSISYEPLDPPF